jgi:hypothetical protein
MRSLTCTALPKHRELKQAWQHACKLILSRASVEEITRQLSLALFIDAMLHHGGARSDARWRLLLKRAAIR